MLPLKIRTAAERAQCEIDGVRAKRDHVDQPISKFFTSNSTKPFREIVCV
jgi:hypothetical protein